ncbi:hypothetical protein L1887_19387 [Cichorium endivia]|nr:hypothetical protein L1887_19387 [Cichorium endivia]
MASLPTDLHFVLFPLMAQGHMIPMVDIARILAQRGATVTIITTPVNSNRFKPVIARAIEDKLKIQVLEFHLPLTEVGLPEGYENFDILPSASLYLKLFQAAELLEAPVENMLRRLTPAPSCIISDNLFPWTYDIARRFGIPRLIFHGPGCFTFTCIHILMNTNILQEIVSDSEYFVLPGISDRIELTKAQGSSWGRRDSERAEMFERVRVAEEASNGIVVNSFQELEGNYVEKLAKAKDKKIGVKIGMEVPVIVGEQDKFGVLVKKEDVKNAVERLMDKQEEGEGRRKRAKELGEMAKRAMEEGGSSHFNMTLMIQDIVNELANNTMPIQKIV